MRVHYLHIHALHSTGVTARMPGMGMRNFFGDAMNDSGFDSILGFCILRKRCDVVTVVLENRILYERMGRGLGVWGLGSGGCFCQKKIISEDFRELPEMELRSRKWPEII